jgi:hypothetical protein
MNIRTDFDMAFEYAKIIDSDVVANASANLVEGTFAADLYVAADLGEPNGH